MAFACSTQNSERLLEVDRTADAVDVNIANLVETVANGHLFGVRSVLLNTPHNGG